MPLAGFEPAIPVDDRPQTHALDLAGFGEFKRWQLIRTVKYADDLELVAKEGTVLQSMTDTLTEIGRCCGIEINVGNTRLVRISWEAFPLGIMIDKKQLKNVECFNCLGSMITNDARCTREIESRIAMAKAASNRKKTLFTGKLNLNLRKTLVKCYIWSIAMCGAETLTLRKVDQLDR